MTAPQATPRIATADRRPDIARAAEALRQGRLVVLPTETVYGIFASATDRGAMDRLLQLAGPPARPADPVAWHASDAGAVRDLLALSHPAHRRLTRRLMPGPVTWIVQVAPEVGATIQRRLGPQPGAIVADQTVAVRVPDHALAGAVAAEAGIPVVARSIAGAGWGSGASLPKGFASAPPEPVAVVLDDGSTRFGRPSTTIRLGLGGTLTIEPGGALEERFVRKHLERTILFICTGNTCRSPMAAAIARSLLNAAPPDGITTTIRSAGTFATSGQPATPEAVEALRRMGVEPGRHASSELDRRAIAEADAIFTMTREHADTVVAIDPSAAARVHTLDPAGKPIIDPIGGPQEVYDLAAAHIRDLLSIRLKELEP